MTGNTHDWGTGLTPDDLARLEARWITPELALLSGIRRVDSATGQQMFGRSGSSKDMSGLIIPNIFPGQDKPRDYRIRLDHPDIEYRIDGTKREIGKYLGPPQRPPTVYFPPGITPEMLDDIRIPVIMTEGEFKALSLWRLSNYNTTKPRFLPIGLQGVDSWRGTIGKTENSSGRRISVKGMLADLAARVWKSRAVVFAYDADVDTSDRVARARSRFMYELIERGALAGTIEWPLAQGKGIDDHLAMVGPEAVLADIANCDFGGWYSQLVRAKNGALIPCFENCRLFLHNTTEWAGAVGYNEFTGTHMILRDDQPTSFRKHQEIEDHFDTEVCCWLDRRHLSVGPTIVARVIDSLGREHAFHPVRDYLESLPPWDFIPRLGKWLITYCGAEVDDEIGNRQYIETIGQKFLVSAVARIFKPGCKADHLLILEGPQGIGKSTIPRILAGDEWFTDQLADLSHKSDAAMALRGRWVIEFGELDVFGRAEMTRVNSFLTQQTDRYRPPYGRHTVEFPRQCVFVGTTNQDTWARDETGARRFWPVRCGQVDIDGLTKDRNQLWAEAVYHYRMGVHWWFEKSDTGLLRTAMDQQADRYLPDPWQGRVIEHAEAQADCFLSGARANSASVTEILDKLGIKVGDQTQYMATRVARCLKVANWVKKRTGGRGDREWRYVRPDTEIAHE